MHDTLDVNTFRYMDASGKVAIVKACYKLCKHYNIGNHSIMRMNTFLSLLMEEVNEQVMSYLYMILAEYVLQCKHRIYLTGEIYRVGLLKKMNGILIEAKSINLVGSVLYLVFSMCLHSAESRNKIREGGLLKFIAGYAKSFIGKQYDFARLAVNCLIAAVTDNSKNQDECKWILTCILQRMPAVSGQILLSVDVLTLSITMLNDNDNLRQRISKSRHNVCFKLWFEKICQFLSDHQDEVNGLRSQIVNFYKLLMLAYHPTKASKSMTETVSFIVLNTLKYQFWILDDIVQYVLKLSLFVAASDWDSFSKCGLKTDIFRLISSPDVVERAFLDDNIRHLCSRLLPLCSRLLPHDTDSEDAVYKMEIKDQLRSPISLSTRVKLWLETTH